MTTHRPPRPDPQLPAPARLTEAIEQDARLDPAVDAIAGIVPSADGPAGRFLRGEWLGHAIHPPLTDLPLGLWTATTALDLLGGVESRTAARRLLGLGLIAAAPTAVTGWAEWSGADRPAKRVGLAHAGLNAAAVGLYAWSWVARRGGRHRTGALLALAGAGAAGAAGYLGGHLASVDRVSSRHPAFDKGSGNASTPIPPERPSDTIRERMPQSMNDARVVTTGADVAAAIAAQHSKITAMVQRVSLGPKSERPEALAELLAYLAGHEAVEEELIHPRATATGSGVGAGRIGEEEGMEQQIERLEQLDADSSSFSVQFGLFEEAVKHHAQAEELQELPVVVDGLREPEAAVIVSALAAQEAAAPTRHGTFAEMLSRAIADVREFVASGRARR